MSDDSLIAVALQAGVEGLADRDIPATWLNLIVASVKQHVRGSEDDPAALAEAFAAAVPVVVDAAPPRVADQVTTIAAGAVGYLRTLMLVAAGPALSEDAHRLHRKVAITDRTWITAYWATLMDWPTNRLDAAVTELVNAGRMKVRRGRLHALGPTPIPRPEA